MTYTVCIVVFPFDRDLHSIRMVGTAASLSAPTRDMSPTTSDQAPYKPAALPRAPRGDAALAEGALAAFQDDFDHYNPASHFRTMALSVVQQAGSPKRQRPRSAALSRAVQTVACTTSPASASAMAANAAEQLQSMIAMRQNATLMRTVRPQTAGASRPVSSPSRALDVTDIDGAAPRSSHPFVRPRPSSATVARPEPVAWRCTNPLQPSYHLASYTAPSLEDPRGQRPHASTCSAAVSAAEKVVAAKPREADAYTQGIRAAVTACRQEAARKAAESSASPNWQSSCFVVSDADRQQARDMAAERGKAGRYVDFSDVDLSTAAQNVGRRLHFSRRSHSAALQTHDIDGACRRRATGLGAAPWSLHTTKKAPGEIHATVGSVMAAADATAAPPRVSDPLSPRYALSAAKGGSAFFPGDRPPAAKEEGATPAPPYGFVQKKNQSTMVARHERIAEMRLTGVAPPNAVPSSCQVEAEAVRQETSRPRKFSDELAPGGRVRALLRRRAADMPTAADAPETVRATSAAPRSPPTQRDQVSVVATTSADFTTGKGNAPHRTTFTSFAKERQGGRGTNPVFPMYSASTVPPRSPLNEAQPARAPRAAAAALRATDSDIAQVRALPNFW